MKIDTEFVQLPLVFDAETLAREVLAIDEASWRPHPQGHPGNSALPLIAAHGDPANDATKGPMRPTAHLGRCPYLRQVLASFDTVFGRTRLMRLDGNAEATAHSDTNYYWLERVRLHVPIVTQPEVSFLCGERSLHMKAGEAWIFDTWQVHNVINPLPTRRIHLVADTVGSAAFWRLVARGARPFGPPAEAAFAPRQVPFDPTRDPMVPTEAVNQPVVMSPWEQEVLLGLLRADLTRSPHAPAGLVGELDLALRDFQQDWREAWARWGVAAAGWERYRQLLATLDGRIAPFQGRLRLPNRADAVEIIRQMVVRAALNEDLAGAVPELHTPAAPAPAPVRMAPAVGVAPPRRFDRPVFVVCPPRSGSSLLFETLAGSPSVWTVGGESHGHFESLPQLHPASRGWTSNRLTADDVTAEAVGHLDRAFWAHLRDRDGHVPLADGQGLRLLEKTPKNALRVPFLAAAYPDARFIYLYRDPRETLSSMLDAWRSGRFVTYPQLPGWQGPPWSLVLVPGWQELVGRPLPEVVAQQWATLTSRLLDDLEALPAERWCVASYDRLLTETRAEVERLCAFADFAWDRPLDGPLPVARHTLTSPAPEKWRHNWEDLKSVMPSVAPVAERAREIFARPPAARPAKPREQAQTLAAPAAAPGTVPPMSFRSVHTHTFPDLLAELGVTVLVSTYQSGRLIALRHHEGKLNTHLRHFPSPMGIAVTPDGFALGVQRAVWQYRNQPAAARKVPPVGQHDACFLPRLCHVTGDVRVHEVALAGGQLWLANTRFSCLATLDGAHSFVPRWRPPFVSALAAEDRCHLNGLAVVDDRVRFVTCLGTTDTAQGWRERKADGGVILEVDSGQAVATGLSMPHSPRFYGGHLWVLESGRGTVATVELATGKVTTIAELPGFTRGLAFVGRYAFIGLSKVRESVFGGIPLGQRLAERTCGVWVLDVTTGRTVAFLRFEGTVEEIFDVQILPGVRFPEIVEPEADLVAASFAVPTAALADVAEN
ncbi:MAG: TIGR03032 family protein [Thermoanaerobaculia bacterium]|nr:TIGR03032 family protein [Thermoanaerobaculia bacterium]